jgi:hypothetical protein
LKNPRIIVNNGWYKWKLPSVETARLQHFDMKEKEEE